MSRDDYVQQGKQFANDLRETASKKVAENEGSILGAIGKAARWVDQKTGGKYSEQIGKAEAKVGEGVGWAAKQGTGEPRAPGAAAGDGTPDAPTGPTSTGPTSTGPTSTGPTSAGSPTGATPTAPGAATTPEPPTGPVGPPTSTPPSEAPTDPGRPTHPPRGGSADRPPQS